MKDVRELIRELGREGTTVFLSSHLLHEVELVCNRAAIVRKGRMIVQGPVSELHPTSNAVKVLTGDQRRALEVLRSMTSLDRSHARTRSTWSSKPATASSPRWCAGWWPTTSTSWPSSPPSSRASRTCSWS